MYRDAESMLDEAIEDAYYEERDERNESEQDAELEDDGAGARMIARWERERGNTAAAEKWESIAEIRAHAARIREAREEMAEELAAVDAMREAA